MNSKLLVLLASLLFLSGGCENEIDINAPYKEVPFVVGLLDASEDEQFIRIQKAYQNSVSQTTEEGAQYPDSLYFDTLVVTVRNLSNNTAFNFLRRYTEKDAGFFTRNSHHIYTCSFKPNISDRYELSIFNPKSGVTYKSVPIDIVEPMTIRENTFQQLKPYVVTAFPVLYIDKVGINSAIHDAFLRTYYLEFDKNTPGIQDTFYIDYYLEKGIKVDFQFGSKRQIPIVPASYYNFLSINISKNPAVSRRLLKIIRHSISGSQFLNDVIELDKDNGGFIDKKRDYSNLTNGAQGIFSSRAQDTSLLRTSSTSFDSTPIFFRDRVPQFIYP